MPHNDHEQPVGAQRQGVGVACCPAPSTSQTTWEELARTWVFRQGLQGRLSFKPEVIGSHWGRSVHAEVAAVSWRERVMLIGECKWGTERVNRQTVRQLIEHTLPKTVAALPNQGWRAIPALFVRAGATSDAEALLREQGVLLMICQRFTPILVGMQVHHRRGRAPEVLALDSPSGGPR